MNRSGLSHRQIIYLTMVLALGTSPAVAQSRPGGQASPGTPSALSKSNPSALGDQAPSGRITRIGGQWRSSELVGATVYNDQGDIVGTIDDLLISSDGRIKSAVLSVGGVLGIGNKLIDVSFEKLQLVPSRVNPAHAGANGTVATPVRAPEVTQSKVQTPDTPGASAATPVQNFDYGVIFPGATKASLRSEPTFTYKPS